MPSLDLLRQITDRHVVDQLLQTGTLTRAEVSARTGISKPTISESMRRLVGTGLVTESGFQTGRRGRAGVNYSLREDLGAAVAISASPAGLLAQTTDIRGQVVDEITRPVPTPVTAAELDPLLRELARAVVSTAPGPIVGAALSLAGPVDRASGRLVHLPDSPFLVDELDARTLLSDLLGPDLHVDNDVNWAALAEYHDGSAVELEDFCYCYLGHGLGGAVVRSGEI